MENNELSRMGEACDNTTATILGFAMMAIAGAGVGFGVVGGAVLEAVAAVFFLGGAYVIAPRRIESFFQIAGNQLKEILNR